MWGFVLGIIILLMALVLFVLGKILKSRGNREDYSIALGGSIIAFLIGAIFVFFSFTTTVSANSVAIVTIFGKPQGVVGSGFNFEPPWASLTEFSTQIQISQRDTTQGGDSAGTDCVEVNLADSASACADITIRYVINKQDAVALWQQYGNFDNARDKLLRTATNNAAKIVYGQYNPQDVVKGTAIPEITTKLTAALSSQLNNSGLTLITVSPGQVHLNGSVQDRLNTQLSATNDLTVAGIILKKNQILAQANDALTPSLNQQIVEEDCIKAATDHNLSPLGCMGSTPTPIVSSGH